mmetsp:Transcript_12021/g.29219  ORF Transcript_12021/g.29219 Transcript_12021/m.29219 type:complete len:215 (+) Transcript_12021:1454-2098(+)
MLRSTAMPPAATSRVHLSCMSTALVLEVFAELLTLTAPSLRASTGPFQSQIMVSLGEMHDAIAVAFDRGSAHLKTVSVTLPKKSSARTPSTSNHRSCRPRRAGLRNRSVSPSDALHARCCGVGKSHSPESWHSTPPVTGGRRVRRDCTTLVRTVCPEYEIVRVKFESAVALGRVYDAGQPSDPSEMVMIGVAGDIAMLTSLAVQDTMLPWASLG